MYLPRPLKTGVFHVGGDVVGKETPRLEAPTPGVTITFCASAALHPTVRMRHNPTSASAASACSSKPRSGRWDSVFGRLVALLDNSS
jgi:hypothetical protein